MLLSFEGVSKGFRRGELWLRVLEDVSLNVDVGEVVSVVGVRGQGKSTLLRLAAGLERPDSGRVLLDGEDLAAAADRQLSLLLRERVGLAGCSGPGIRLSVLEYVAMPLLTNRGRGARRAAYTRASSALERVGAQWCAGERWENLSDLDRALVEIAQAVVSQPRLLLIDDVTDGLPERATERIAMLVRALAAERELGVLMGLSDGEAALAGCRVHSLSRGHMTLISDRASNRANVRELVAGSGVRSDSW